MFYNFFIFFVAAAFNFPAQAFYKKKKINAVVIVQIYLFVSCSSDGL